MNRLWVRLSLVFGIVIVIGTGLNVLLSASINQNAFINRLVRDHYAQPGGLIDQLVMLYNRTGSWDAAIQFVADQDALLPRTFDGRLNLIFADAGGNILFSPNPALKDTALTPEQRADALALIADGRVRGYLYVMESPLQPNAVPVQMPLGGEVPEDIQRLARQQFNLLLGRSLAVVGVVSIVAGVIFSRFLTAPLADLAETVRAFGAKNLSKRAKIKGSAEIIAVARAFNDMAAELERGELLRRSLTADIAHELRTPLTVLRANLQALQDGVYPLTQDEVERLLEQTELLGHLVSDLHELAQAEARQLRLDRTPTDLTALVERLADQFTPLAAQHDLTLTTVLPAESVLCAVDARRIEQVLHNILNNALTHTPSGGQVHLRLEADDQTARMVIKDTGSGIAPEYLPYIFERFYRADKARSRQTGGAGLGLAIAKAIIELHGGTIRAESSGVAGEGTTFTICLPLA